MNSPIIKEFRDFLLQGSLLELAVAFIMAAAFGAVVAVFTEGIIMAFIAAIFGEPNFDAIGLDIGDGRLLIGSFLTALMNLIIVGAAVFFFIVRPAKMLKARQKDEGVTEPISQDTELLKEIRDLLRNRP